MTLRQPTSVRLTPEQYAVVQEAVKRKRMERGEPVSVSSFLVAALREKCEAAGLAWPADAVEPSQT